MSDTAPITIEQRLEELEKFRDFAQPIVINCGRLWDRTHEREGLKDYFKTETHHAQPLIELGKAIDEQVTPLTQIPAPPPITESTSVL